MKIVVKKENIETEVEVVGIKKKNRFVCQVDLIQRATQQFLKSYETTLLFVTYEKVLFYQQYFRDSSLSLVICLYIRKGTRLTM